MAGLTDKEKEWAERAAGVLQLSPGQRIVGWLLLLGGWVTAVVGITLWWVDHFATPSTDSGAKAILIGAGVLGALPLIIIGWFKRPASPAECLGAGARPRRIEPLVTESAPTVAIPARHSGTSVQVAAPHPQGSSLKVSTGEGGPFLQIKARHIHNEDRTFAIRIDNADERQAVTDIKLSIVDIAPAPERGGPWVVDEGFSLAAGDHKFIPVVTYEEASRQGAYRESVYNRSPSFFEMLVKGRPLVISRERPITVIFRVTGIGSAPRDHRCYIWVDRPDGRLRIADFLPAATGHEPLGLGPLSDAMRRFYEANINTDDGEHARAVGKNEDGLLNFCAELAASRGLQVFGCRSPSLVQEPIPPETLANLQFIGGATELHGGYPLRRVYSTLTCLYSELEQLLRDSGAPQ